ncbi:MAG TPA: efflux RND transporter periplasmic adaptor subunit [Candidatus Acidoferrales bacterium]|nr:efflux RND transporter periplasmic adaptor subunit [Candidatus Acidoferrales bacterium]
MNTKPLLLIPLLLASCAKKEEKEVEAPAPVQVTAVTQDTVRRTVAGDGVLFPKDQASVMPKISAPVQKFYVKRGDHVKEGQVLAVLENRDLTAAAAESRDAVAVAESNLRMTQGANIPEAVVKAQTDVEAAREAADAAKKVLESRNDLLKQGALARRQVEEAQVNYAKANSDYLAAQEHLRALQAVGKEEQVKTAAAQVAAAKSHAVTTETQLSYSRIVSPKTGIIADRPLYEGDMASPTTALLTVMDISSVVARINVTIAEATQVKLGMPATLSFVDGREPVEGKVTVVSPASDPASTTVQVWIEAPNPGEKLKPGAGVHAVIVAEAIKAATVVPVAAILPGEEGGTAVLVIDSNSTAHRRAVRLGVRDGDKIQVLNGCRPGEEVVVQGGVGVDDKAKVKVIDTTVKEADEDEDNAPEAPPAKDQKKEEARPKSK